MRYFIWMFFSLVFIPPAIALEEQTIYSVETYTLDKIVDQMSNYTSTPEGGVGWKVFSETQDIPYKIIRDGEEWGGIKPAFPEAVKKLDGQKIKMSGYMFPLDQTEEQSQFLFGPFPLTCPYHYHTSNRLTIEAHAENPIKFSYEPITIEGILELVPEDYEFNTYYRLRKVTTVK